MWTGYGCDEVKTICFYYSRCSAAIFHLVFHFISGVLTTVVECPLGLFSQNSIGFGWWKKMEFEENYMRSFSFLRLTGVFVFLSYLENTRYPLKLVFMCTLCGHKSNFSQETLKTYCISYSKNNNTSLLEWDWVFNRVYFFPKVTIVFCFCCLSKLPFFSSALALEILHLFWKGFLYIWSYQSIIGRVICWYF